MDNLSGFDPSTMTYLTTQMVQPNANFGDNMDPFSELLLQQADASGPHTPYNYALSDDLSMHPLQQYPPALLHRMSSAYEDPFSDDMSAFDQPTGAEGNAEMPSIDRDNKLLSFSLPSFDYALLDYTYRRTTISISAQLHGMFFLAESPWAAGEESHAPNELTCYRRNLFQISGEVTLPQTLRYILTESGEQIPIVGQELVISAAESTEGTPVKIISVPWKTPANPSAPASEEKVEREPASIPLDLMSVAELESDFATFPFQWKRLQFRIATANNGRRKELQQHFVVKLKLIATLATGGKVSICEVQSGAIIVRGRSPRNFQSRKDLPLNGSGHIRKGSHLQASRASSNDSASGSIKRLQDGPTSAPIKVEADQVPMQSYFDQAPPQADFTFDWKTVAHNQPGAMPPPGPTSSPFRGGHPFVAASPDLARVASSTQPPFAPINLSLVEDEAVRSSKSVTPPEQRLAKRISPMPRPPSFSLGSLNSPDESADLLYEYFPLGLDDWMPPVEAVYRPHVVHHTKLPTDPRDPHTSGKSARSKRYFAEDVT